MASIHHFDVIILGAGLWGRMAAVLLSRKGLRVLAFVGPSGPVPDFLPLSPAMKQLAVSFGPLSSRPRPSDDLQVITPDIRFNFNGLLPIEEELRRELPGCWKQVLNLLQRLEGWGHRLEEVLLRHSEASAAAFSGKLLLQSRLVASGLALKGISRKFSLLLARLGDRQARQFLSALFAGLTLGDPRSLTVAEAALSWHAATCPRGLNGAELSQAVERVFQKSHVQSRPMEDLASLDVNGKKLEFASLRDGTRLGAGCFFVDQYLDSTPWPKSWRIKTPPVPVVSEYWQLSDITPGPSSLLASRIILAGSPPLVLTLSRHTENGWGAIVNQAADANLPLLENDQLRRRIEPVLPFSSYRLQRRPEQVGVSIPGAAFPHFGPHRIGPGALCCGTSTAKGGRLDLHSALKTLMAAGTLGNITVK